MEAQELFNPLTSTQLDQFDLDTAKKYIGTQEKALKDLFSKYISLANQFESLKQRELELDEEYILMKTRFFGRSSEKSAGLSETKEEAKKRSRKQKRKVQLPSERYPEAPIVEQEVLFADAPECDSCGEKMTDSGMSEDSEFLTVERVKYFVVRQKRKKYRCSCHGSIKTAPNPPRIKPGSGYSDEMILDVALSKYCDLIPVERYASIAAREGIEGLPPQSLIQLTHYLADFLFLIYERLKTEVFTSRVIHGDETPHRMLEEHEDKSWYLWGFSTKESVFFEIRNTRSGDVASSHLIQSNCEYLVTDVFSGYNKAVKETNKARIEQGRSGIYNVYCNAHARRKFDEAKDSFPEESLWFIEKYRKIYHLDSKETSPDQRLKIRQQIKPLFEEMRLKAMELSPRFSSKSSLVKATNYFLNNYEGLTRFLTDPELPIDNNHQERQLRNPVVGRKTWWGTHSQRGAKTTAIIFSIVESCKINGVNPREYFKNIVADLHAGKDPPTPKDYKKTTSQ